MYFKFSYFFATTNHWSLERRFTIREMRNVCESENLWTIFLSLHHSLINSCKSPFWGEQRFLTEELDSRPLFQCIWCFNGDSVAIVLIFCGGYVEGASSPSCLFRNFWHHSEWCWGFMALDIKSSIHLSFRFLLLCVLPSKLWTPAWQSFVLETVIIKIALQKAVCYWYQWHIMLS